MKAGGVLVARAWYLPLLQLQQPSAVGIATQKAQLTRSAARLKLIQVTLVHMVIPEIQEQIH